MAITVLDCAFKYRYMSSSCQCCGSWCSILPTRIRIFDTVDSKKIKTFKETIYINKSTNLKKKLYLLCLFEENSLFKLMVGC